MKETPILILKQSLFSRRLNQIFGFLLIGFGIYISTLPLYDSDSGYDLVAVGIGLFFLGLYSFHKSTHRIFLFEYEIQSKTWLAATKIPLDSSSHAFISEVSSKNGEYSITTLFIITPTQNKKMTISIDKWHNYDDFETAFNTRLNELNPDVSNNKSKAIRHRTHKKTNQNNRKFSFSNTSSTNKIKGISTENLKSFQKNKSKNLSNTYEKGSVKIVRTQSRRIPKSPPKIQKSPFNPNLGIKIGTGFGFLFSLGGFIWMSSAIINQDVNMYRYIFNAVFIIFIGIGVMVYYQSARTGNDFKK
jgi:hypothetical protein